MELSTRRFYLTKNRGKKPDKGCYTCNYIELHGYEQPCKACLVGKKYCKWEPVK